MAINLEQQQRVGPLKVNTDIVPDSEPSPTNSYDESPSSSSIGRSDSLPLTIIRSTSESYPYEVSSTSSLPTLSTKSMTTPNIKFAPLPHIAPRKRKSHQPLGVAARSEIMRRRRGVRGHNNAQGLGNNQLEEERLRQAQSQANINAQEIRLHGSNAENNHRKKKLSGDDTDDPIISFGKLVKGAGITLWRKMADAQRAKEEDKTKAKDSHGPVAKPNGALSSILIKSSTTVIPVPPLPSHQAWVNMTPNSSASDLSRPDNQSEQEGEEDRSIEDEDGSFLELGTPTPTPTRPALPSLPEPLSGISVGA